MSVYKGDKLVNLEYTNKREVERNKLEIHPSQFFREYIMNYQIPSKEDGVSSTVKVPSFVGNFINVVQKDEVSRVKVTSGMITYGLQEIVKKEWNIPIIDIVNRVQKNSKNVLSGDNYNTTSNEFSPKYEIKVDKLEHTRLDKSISRDIGNIKRALKCNRSIIKRHLMIISILYSSSGAIRGEDIENWHHAMRMYHNHFKRMLNSLVDEVQEKEEGEEE